MTRWNARFLAFAFAIASTLPALAAVGPQEGEPAPPELKLSTSLSPTPVRSPGEATLTLTVEIPTGYHLFAGKELRVEAEGPVARLLGTPAYPAGEVEEGIAVLRGRASIRVPLTVPAGEAGPIRGTLLLKWQACQDYGEKICFLPARSAVSIEAPVILAPPAPAGPAPETPAPTPPVVEPAVEPASPPEAVPQPEAPQGGSFQDRFGQAARENVPFALLLAFLFGVLSSLTPCVYPVIPITVAYIGSRSEGKGRAHGFLLSLAFVLGLALLYAMLGAVSAKAGQTFGSLAQTPWVGIPVALLFFALALSMFNLFEFKTPARLTNRIEQTKQKSRGGGFVGAFLIGALSGLVASPCIGPLILAILVVVASTGSSFLGFLYLFTFALGLGLLFLVIGTFSGVLAALPKSGGWMDGVRVLFGALILAAAFYFAGLYLPRPAFWLASGLGLGFVAGFLLFGASRH
ncbi:MAG: cytochrome c biogenesis protein CcdA, partial [Acidobacteriota bacterium]